MLADVLETRVRKEKELEYYQKELEKLQEKMFFIKKDIDITNLIIDMIEKENVIDIRQHMLEKKKMTEKQERYHEWILRKLREMRDSDNETDK